MPRWLAVAVSVLGLAVAGVPAASASPLDRGAARAAAAGSTASGFYIRGGGFGHGIGMSQYGALGYAQHGWSYAAILAHYYEGTKLGRLTSEPTVTVLLKDGSAGFTGATRAGGHALKAGTYYTARPVGSGKIELLASGRKVGIYSAPVTVSGRGPLDLAGLGLYRGSLVLRPDGGGGLETVDAVDLEDYVRGVVSAEMPASWPAAALEVQAIAARTYALTAGAAGSDFDVYSDTRSQVYRGVAAETPSTDAAVAATRAQVVTYRGVPAVTYFFASSGGYTESIQNVWPGASPEPWLRGVRDPYDGAGPDPYHRWVVSLSVGAAAARLGRLVKGGLVGIQILRHGVSPRVITASVVGTRGRTTVSGAQLQGIFGLMSTWMTFTTISTRPSAGAVSGSVFPVLARTLVLVQKLGGRGWATVARVRTGRGGSYRSAVAGAGRYRVSYGGVAGPVVNAG